MDVLEKILKGGEIVNKNDLLNCEDKIEQFTINDNNYKKCLRKIKNTNGEYYYIINFYSSDTNCVLLALIFSIIFSLFFLYFFHNIFYFFQVLCIF